MDTPAAVIPLPAAELRLCVRTSLTRTSDPRYPDTRGWGLNGFSMSAAPDDHGGAWEARGAEGEELGHVDRRIPFLG